MNTEKIEYDKYVLDPSKDVLVPMGVYVAVVNVVQQVEKEHSKRIRTDKYAYFHKETHKKLSNKSRSKMKPEKLAKEYYENIDLEKTAKDVRVDRDELGTAAVRLMGEFKGIFRYNVDEGNGMLRPDPNLPQSPPVVQQSENTQEDSEKNEG